jgi:anti-anti-sigma factor
MLRIEIQSRNDMATLYCSGRLIFGVEVEMLRTMVMSRPESLIRIDLARVENIDATGLGLLVELHSWAADNNRNLTLLELSAPIWRLVILTKLHNALRISYSGVAELCEETDGPDLRELIA